MTRLCGGIRRHCARNRVEDGFVESIFSDTYLARPFEYFYNDKNLAWSDEDIPPYCHDEALNLSEGQSGRRIAGACDLI